MLLDPVRISRAVDMWSKRRREARRSAIDTGGREGHESDIGDSGRIHVEGAQRHSLGRDTPTDALARGQGPARARVQRRSGGAHDDRARRRHRALDAPLLRARCAAAARPQACSDRAARARHDPALRRRLACVRRECRTPRAARRRRSPRRRSPLAFVQLRRAVGRPRARGIGLVLPQAIEGVLPSAAVSRRPGASDRSGTSSTGASRPTTLRRGSRSTRRSSSSRPRPTRRAGTSRASAASSSERAPTCASTSTSFTPFRPFRACPACAVPARGGGSGGASNSSSAA